MAALHALQDHVVAGLQGKMEVRHQPALRGDRLAQVVIDLDRIDGGEAQAREFGQRMQDRADEAAEGWRLVDVRALEIAAVAGQIDARQHDLAGVGLDQPAALRDHGIDSKRA